MKGEVGQRMPQLAKRLGIETSLRADFNPFNVLEVIFGELR